MQNTRIAFLLISFLFIVSACKQNAKPINQEIDTINSADTNSVEVQDIEEKDVPYSERKEYRRFLDSMSLLGYDTSTIELKSKALVHTYNIENCQYLLCSTKDTLFDFNYDGYKDLAIYYFGHAGSGLKNFADVYLFNITTNRFTDTAFKVFDNPSFYIEDKEITEFYIAQGGGYGTQYKWQNGEWITSKTCSFFSSETALSIWRAEIINIETNDTSYRKVLRKDNFPVPDNKILRNNYN